MTHTARKETRIIIRVSHEERAMIEAIAKDEGRSISGLVRYRLLHDPRSPQKWQPQAPF